LSQSLNQSESVPEEEKAAGGFLYNYMQTILANLEIKITNIHIRYEAIPLAPRVKTIWEF